MKALVIALSIVLLGTAQDTSEIRNFLRVNKDFCTGGQPKLEHLEKLKAEGVKFTLGPEPNRPGSKDHVAFIQDPDGYTLELTERHSTSGPPVKTS